MISRTVGFVSVACMREPGVLSGACSISRPDGLRDTCRRVPPLTIRSVGGSVSAVSGARDSCCDTEQDRRSREIIRGAPGASRFMGLVRERFGARGPLSVSSIDWKRPVRVPRPAEPSSSSILSVFYGYPDHLIAQWCGVSVRTAADYKSGKSRPSKAVMRLFLLHRENRVLGPEWKGWRIKPDGLVDPDGNETTQAQLRAYFFIVQFARGLAADRGENVRAEFYRLLSG